MDKRMDLCMFASELGNLYEVICDTKDDFIALLFYVENGLHNLRAFDMVKELEKVIDERFGGELKLGEAKVFNLRSSMLDLLYEKSKTVRIHGINVFEPSSIYTRLGRYNSVRYLITTNLFPISMEAWGYVQLLDNIGNAMGWDEVLSIADTVSKRYGTNLYDVVKFVSEFKFKKVTYLSKRGFTGTCDALELDKILEKYVVPRDLLGWLGYFYEDRGVLVEILGKERVTATSLTHRVTITFSYNVSDLMKAFDTWLSIYTYYYLLYNELYKLLFIM